MADPFLTITGIDETCKMFQDATNVVVNLGFPPALAAAGGVLEAALWPRTPLTPEAIGNEAHGGKGPLASDLQVRITIDADGRGGFVDVGFWGLGHIAWWVEFGHRIVGPKPDDVSWKRFRQENMNHLGDVPPHPFMRPAFYAVVDDAVAAFFETLSTVLAGEYSGN